MVICCVVKPAPGYCSFEDQGLCMWANTQDGDDLDWVKTQGQTASQNSGPDYDHTTGTYLGKNLQLLQFRPILFNKIIMPDSWYKGEVPPTGNVDLVRKQFD